MTLPTSILIGCVLKLVDSSIIITGFDVFLLLDKIKDRPIDFFYKNCKDFD